MLTILNFMLWIYLPNIYLFKIYSKMAAPLIKHFGILIPGVIFRRPTVPIKLSSKYLFEHYDQKLLCLSGKIDQEKPLKVFYSSGTGSTTTTINNQDRLGLNLTGLNRFMLMYEDFVGLTEVKQAQEKVVNAEQKFLQVQEDRRSMQQELLAVQAEVRKVAAELEKTSRTDSRYIDLVKKEHEILLVEKEMNNKIKTLDKAERDFFSLLSAALRESHEKERARAEKTKYWSIIGSVVGAIIGIAGTTFNNMKRMKELRAIITESAENTAEYKEVADNLIKTVASQQSKSENFISPVSDDSIQVSKLDMANLTNPFLVNHKILKEHTDTILSHTERQSNTLMTQLNEVQKVLAVNMAGMNSDQVVYVGPELEVMLQRTEQKLEKVHTKNTLVAAAAMTLSMLILAFIIKGT
ncbi:Coiled-coil domain-containing protein 51 [Bulinus truncatus]|nr:Coiled-coil domain-containing protein 51 [Bulinus truncatus]